MIMFRLFLSIFFLLLLLSSFGLGQVDVNNYPLNTATAITVDKKHNLYLTGWTEGTLGQANQGEADVFLAKYDAEGNQIWIKQFGTEAKDTATALDVDKSGAVFIIGSTEGTLGREDRKSVV